MQKCEVLRRKQNTSLLAVYVNSRHTNRFIVGSVQAADDECAILSLYDSSGKPDGIGLILLDSVYRIEKDTIYLKKFGIDFTHGARFLICDNTWNYFLNMATVQQRLLTITMLGGKKIRGFIEKFDDDKMSLNILFPKKASKRLVHRMHIAWICFDSQDEREIENRHGGKVEK